MAASDYPRPDFERPGLRWQSLDGPWDFLFDDDDVGLAGGWALDGLPQEVATQGPRAAAGEGAESESITQRIAAGTQALYADNAFAAGAAGAVQRRRTIQVPFVFQSRASGIEDGGVHEVLWYERRVPDLRTAEERRQGRRLVLRFGAVDYAARVWVNGRFVGGHRGGHVPFQLDVTEAVDASSSSSSSPSSPPAASASPSPSSPPSSSSPTLHHHHHHHRLTLRVSDSAYDLSQPRGKQYWAAKPESIFYTPSGGIWQSVWLEVLPAAAIADGSHGTVLRADDIASGVLRCHVAVLGRRRAQACSVEVEAALGGVVVAVSDRKPLSRETDAVDVELATRLSPAQRARLPAALVAAAPLASERCWRDGVALWSPEHPLLYDVTLRLRDAPSGRLLDEVRTQAGMRSLDWSRGDGLWRLNGRPYFQALCLDQGYWPASLMTPPGPDAVRADIERAKRMGFNGCRKHQKVEDPRFYYWADRLGYLVWAEMANAYQFGAEYADRFTQEWTESVRLAINHASVVTWTPVNESWGYPSLKHSAEQRHHVRALYHLTKALDPTRSVNDNCGWEHVCSDLTTFHDYGDGPELERNCASLDRILGPKAGRDLFVGGAAHTPGAPIMCTEFGGVNIAPASPADGAERPRDWGYTTATDARDLLARFERLVRAVTDGGLCCAFVYTQLTDIEQEANGLYTFDRHEKLDAAKVKAVIDGAVQAFYARVASS